MKKLILIAIVFMSISCAIQTNKDATPKKDIPAEELKQATQVYFIEWNKSKLVTDDPDYAFTPEAYAFKYIENEMWLITIIGKAKKGLTTRYLVGQKFLNDKGTSTYSAIELTIKQRRELLTGH